MLYINANIYSIFYMLYISAYMFYISILKYNIINAIDKYINTYMS